MVAEDCHVHNIESIFTKEPLEYKNLTAIRLPRLRIVNLSQTKRSLQPITQKTPAIAQRRTSSCLFCGPRYVITVNTCTLYV